MLDHSQSRLNLTRAFVGFMMIAAIGFFAVTVFFTSQRVSGLQNDLLRASTERQGLHISFHIGNHLEEHWHDLVALASYIPFSNTAMIRAFLTREVGIGDHMLWAAQVDVNGDILIASHREGEGENIAPEDWFQAAQRGPSVRFDRTSAGTDILVMSTPILISETRVAGFLVFHFDPAWLNERLSEIARALSLNVIVFDDRSRLALQTFAFDESNSALASVRNALSGQNSVSLEDWTGLGRQYASTIPNLRQGAMPMLGWRAVVLLSFDSFAAETEQLRLDIAKILGGVTLALFLMSLVFIRVFFVPLHRLIRNAHEIALGAEIVPLENHRTAELSVLSSAISRLQGRIMRAEDRAVKLQQQIETGQRTDITPDQS